MNLLTRAQHGYLDILLVVAFGLAPVVVGLESGAAVLSYVLAAGHLLMTLLTEGLPFSAGRLIPLPLHGLIEAVVGIGLGLIGWLVFDGGEQAFFLVMAAVVLGVFALTPYLDKTN